MFKERQTATRPEKTDYEILKEEIRRKLAAPLSAALRNVLHDSPAEPVETGNDLAVLLRKSDQEAVAARFIVRFRKTHDWEIFFVLLQAFELQVRRAFFGRLHTRVDAGFDKDDQAVWSNETWANVLDAFRLTLEDVSLEPDPKRSLETRFATRLGSKLRSSANAFKKMAKLEKVFASRFVEEEDEPFDGRPATGIFDFSRAHTKAERIEPSAEEIEAAEQHLELFLLGGVISRAERDLLVDRYARGLTEKQVAAARGLTSKAIEHRVADAKKKLVEATQNGSRLLAAPDEGGILPSDVITR